MGVFETFMIIYVFVTAMQNLNLGFPNDFKWPLIVSGIFVGIIYIILHEKYVSQIGQLGIFTATVFVALTTYQYSNMIPFNMLPQLGTLSWVDGTLVSVDVTTQHIFSILMVLVGIMIGVYYKRWKDGLIDGIWEEFQR